MSFARFKESFDHLPRHFKFIGAGSLVLALSTLLPWYADLDAYKIGDQFLGVTGPASFVGVAVLVLAGLSFWIFLYHIRGRHAPRLPVREGIIHLAAAVESFFLLVLVNSIYFHPKFGVNITLKESRFGMTLAFLGTLALFVGGYILNREEIEKRDETGKLEPLIKIEPQNPQVPPPPYQRSHAPVVAPRPAEPKRIFPHAREETKGFLFGESRGTAVKPTPESAPQSEVKSDKKDGGEGSFMIRMDL